VNAVRNVLPTYAAHPANDSSHAKVIPLNVEQSFAGLSQSTVIIYDYEVTQFSMNKSTFPLLKLGRPAVLYIMSLKKLPACNWFYLCQMLTDLQNSFTAGKML